MPTDPVPPNPYIMPVGPAPNNPEQWNARQQKLRAWQTANPSRTLRDPMGVNPNTSVNYDQSLPSYMGRGTTGRGHGQPENPITNVTSGGTLTPPGAFNGANPATVTPNPRLGAGTPLRPPTSGPAQYFPTGP